MANNTNLRDGMTVTHKGVSGIVEKVDRHAYAGTMLIVKKSDGHTAILKPCEVGVLDWGCNCIGCKSARKMLGRAWAA